MVKTATVIVFSLFGLILLIVGLLAYFFSALWWLVIIPFLLILSVFIVIRLVALQIIQQLYTDRLTREQKIALAAFNEKIESIVEARATPWPVFVLISVKDLVLHRDLTSIKKLLSDSTSLRSDYHALERLF